MRIRVVLPNAVQFMVNPMPVTNGGKPKRDRLKRPVYWSAAGMDGMPHPAAFQFVVSQ